MKYIIGQNRNQVEFVTQSLDESIDQDNEVRLIDAFVVFNFSYIITKRTMKRATADVGLIFTAYNLRRIMNIIGIEVFRSYLLALLAVLGVILASLEAFCRTQKVQLQNSLQKNRFLRIDLMATLAGQNFSKINFKEGY